MRVGALSARRRIARQRLARHAYEGWSARRTNLFAGGRPLQLRRQPHLVVLNKQRLELPVRLEVFHAVVVLAR